MTTAVPEGYMKDARGRLNPIGTIKPIDLLRNQTVIAIAEQAKNLSAILAKFKSVTFSDLDAFVATSAEQYQTKVGGKKGYVTLFSYDGQYKVVRSFQDMITFDEQLQVAKSLVDECLKSWTNQVRDEVKVLVNDAFRVDSKGQVRTQEVLGLRRHNFKDPTWLQAMDAISNAVQIVGSKPYIRIYERVGETTKYQPISLDIANL